MTEVKDLSALPIFARVVSVKSFAEAARQLNMPTTTVSRRIQQLENELGGKLLNRTTRSLSLTELGQQVLPKAQLVADTITELCYDAEQMVNQPVGTLTITAPRALSQGLLAPLIAEFMHQYPKIGLNLSVSNRFENLSSNNIDFAFRLGPLQDSSLVALPLSPVENVVAISTALNNTLGPANHPNDLSHLPRIHNHVDGHFLPWTFSNHSEQIEINSTPSVVVDDLIVAKQLTVDGIGISYLPVYLFEKEIREQQVEIILEGWRTTKNTLMLVYQDRRHLPLKAQLFIDFIKGKRQLLSERLTASG